MKTCSKCRVAKPLSEFYRDKTRAKPTSWCKACSQAASSAYYAANTEKAKAAHKAWVTENKERVAAHKARSAFGLTQAQWDAMPMVCVICGATERLCIDHSHQTGRVRGRLCAPCNKGLGFFRDNPTLLLRAADFLFGIAKPDIFEATYEPAGGTA